MNGQEQKLAQENKRAKRKKAKVIEMAKRKKANVKEMAKRKKANAKKSKVKEMAKKNITIEVKNSLQEYMGVCRDEYLYVWKEMIYNDLAKEAIKQALNLTKANDISFENALKVAKKGIEELFMVMKHMNSFMVLVDYEHVLELALQLLETTNQCLEPVAENQASLFLKYMKNLDWFFKEYPKDSTIRECFISDLQLIGQQINPIEGQRLNRWCDYRLPVEQVTDIWTLLWKLGAQLRFQLMMRLPEWQKQLKLSQDFCDIQNMMEFPGCMYRGTRQQIDCVSIQNDNGSRIIRLQTGTLCRCSRNKVLAEKGISVEKYLMASACNAINSYNLHPITRISQQILATSLKVTLPVGGTLEHVKHVPKYIVTDDDGNPYSFINSEMQECQFIAKVCFRCAYEAQCNRSVDHKFHFMCNLCGGAMRHPNEPHQHGRVSVVMMKNDGRIVEDLQTMCKGHHRMVTFPKRLCMDVHHKKLIVQFILCMTQYRISFSTQTYRLIYKYIRYTRMVSE